MDQEILISASILIWIIELPQTLVTPLNAWQLPYKLWYTAGFILPYRYGDRIYLYLDCIRAGSKILNDDAYLYSSISKSDVSERRVLVVPTFSPEVKFLVDMDISAKTACKLLRDKDIRYLIIDERSSPYFSNFKQFPFFRDYKSLLKLILYCGDKDIMGECLYEIPEIDE
ncbi:MAG: hypothetical protein WCL00_07160 [Bacteroidota bacterium]